MFFSLNYAETIVNNTGYSGKHRFHVTKSSCNQTSNEITLLHKRFSHPSNKVLKHLLNNYTHIKPSPRDIKLLSTTLCEARRLSKVHKLYFTTTEAKKTQALELIHTDLWRPSLVLSQDNYRYYISFVDEFSSYTWIYPLRHKSEALDVFKVFKLQVENQFSQTIKTQQSNWCLGGECRVFTDFLNQSGIKLRHSCRYTHHQNGLVEKKHRHIVELGLTYHSSFGGMLSTQLYIILIGYPQMYSSTYHHM